jgi:hypothetical protein
MIGADFAAGAFALLVAVFAGAAFLAVFFTAFLATGSGALTGVGAGAGVFFAVFLAAIMERRSVWMVDQAMQIKVSRSHAKPLGGACSTNPGLQAEKLLNLGQARNDTRPQLGNSSFVLPLSRRES